MTPALRNKLPLLATAGIAILLFAAASLLYPGFCAPQVVINFFTDNAFLGIVAVGMTLVIFTGGIDLSVGAVVGFTAIFTATLIQNHGVHPLLAAALALATGAAFGAFMGAIIHIFKQPPFLITLAGMFLARGAAFWITTDQIEVQHPLYNTIRQIEWNLGSTYLSLNAVLLFLTLLAGYIIAHHTRFGRNLIAIGGNEQSALLMGLPVGATKIAVYALSSLLAAFAGIVAMLAMSGNPSLGNGMELDAIAVVVIGGTLLSGGRGHMLGTLFGFLAFSTIQGAITFDGRLNSAWTRIVVAALLLVFILLQRTLANMKIPSNRKTPQPGAAD